jgi:hypothetical protein
VRRDRLAGRALAILPIVGTVGVLATAPPTGLADEPALKKVHAPTSAGFEAATPRTAHLHAVVDMPSLNCSSTSGYRAVLVSVALLGRSGSESLAYDFGDCSREGANWHGFFSGAGRVLKNRTLRARTGDRIAIDATLGPHHDSGIVVRNLTTGKSKDLRGPRHFSARAAILDVAPEVHGSRGQHRYPLAHFDPFHFSDVTINGRPLGAFDPRAYDLAFHGRVKVKTGPLKHGRHFTETLRP